MKLHEMFQLSALKSSLEDYIENNTKDNFEYILNTLLSYPEYVAELQAKYTTPIELFRGIDTEDTEISVAVNDNVNRFVSVTFNINIAQEYGEKILKYVCPYSAIVCDFQVVNKIFDFDLDHEGECIIDVTKCNGVGFNENVNFKSSTNGEFMQYDFYDNGKHIGNINLRLKRGWNQLHIDINPEFQKKGYSIIMISEIIEKFGYISIPEGRIINNDMYKVINRLKSRYNYYESKFNEHILYKSNVNLDSLKDIFDK